MNNDKLINEMNRTIEKTNFSGVISIKKNNQSIFETAAGYRDISNELPNNLNTRFAIASGTKFFTALAIGKLIEDGKLTFSTKIKDYIPYDFPTYSDSITIRHLLTHSSGIPDYYDEELVEDFNNFYLHIPWSQLRTPTDYLPVLPQDKMKFDPGKQFSYSNSGFILLGVIIEEITKMKYSDFVTEKIFPQAEMHESGYFAFDRLPANTASGYIIEENSWRTNIYNLPIIGGSDGGAYTTVHDLENMWKNFFQGRIIDLELVKEFIKPHISTNPENENDYYGYGIWIYKEQDNQSDYITGCDAGVSFQSGINRNEDFVYSVISNTMEGAWKIINVIIEHV